MRWFPLWLFFAACGNSGGGLVMTDAESPDSADARMPDAPVADGGLNLPPIAPYPTCPTCQHAQYVIDHIVVPQSNAQAMALGCDINADGEVDNQLGKLLGALKAASQYVDAQVDMNAAFQRGVLVMLYDVEYDPSVTMTQVAGLRAFIGYHDASDGLTAPAFYMGQGHFTTSYENGTGMGGAIQGGAGHFGPNGAVLQFTLIDSGPLLTVPLERASVSGTFSSSGIQTGKLCGAIDGPFLRSTMIPQLAIFFSSQVKLGGATADTFKSLFDADHSCDIDPACAPSASGTCLCISNTEVENNSIFRALFNPDLDLDPNATNPFVTDTSDPTYVNDALSVGFGFSANHAAFPLP